MTRSKHHAKDWNELQLSETPAVELLERLGYTFIPGERLESEAERPSLKQPILTARLEQAITRLNPWISPENATLAAKRLTQVQSTGLLDANQQLHNLLTRGESVRQDLGSGLKGHQVRYFDFDDPLANELVVTTQYRVLGTRRHIIPDVLVFINGIPLAVIECKSPHLGDGTKWRGEAVKQLHRYQESKEKWRNEGAPRLFETVQVLIAACGTNACYGTTLTPGRFFFEWREPYPAQGQALREELEGLTHGVRAQEEHIYSLLRPHNLLDIVRNFIVFELEQGRTVKKLCRYKQFIAVNKAIERITGAAKTDERGGVVWHTQGSGKSLTMVWLALKLRRDKRLQNPGIVIVTDRTALDRQIARTFKDCGFDRDQAESVRNLRELLQNPIGRTIMTTVQKFQELGEDAPEDLPESKKNDPGRRRDRKPLGALCKASNIVVMVDEAHRSQYRSLAANMRAALPHAAFVGFTGTPIDKKDKSTLRAFGPYIDTYTIAQAVADGATVRIVYEGRMANMRLVGAKLDTIFARMFADYSDEERAQIKKRYTSERALAEAPKRIEAIALDIIEHFDTRIEPNGFKAQIAASSREAALAYYDALTELNGPSRALVISVGHNDEAKFTPHARTNEEVADLVERFVEEPDPRILIVCDRLLTGFDAPVEQVLYLDKPLREHNLLQAIARTNRRYGETKEYGLIVDYWGVSEELEEALAIFDPEQVKGALEPKLDELPRLEARLAAAKRFFDGVADKSDLSACIEALHQDDVWAAFDQAFRAFASSLDMLYPEPEALKFTNDAKWLGRIRKAARSLPGRGGPDLSDCGGKVRKLIEDSIVADEVQILFEAAPIFSDSFARKLDALKSPRAKASLVEHALRHEIHVKLDENPAFYGSLKDRLEQIIRDYEAGRIEAAQLLQLQLALRTELVGGGVETADALALSGRGFAIYGLLAKAGDAATLASEDADPNARRDLASTIDGDLDPYTKYVDWHENHDVLKKMRSLARKRLKGMDRKAGKLLASEIVELTKKRKGK